MTGCGDCGGTGFAEVKRGTVRRCDCLQRAIAARMTAISHAPGTDPAVAGLVEALQARRGPGRAIKAKELAIEVFGSESGRRAGADRRLRALAHAATEAGVPVASGDKGYFLATAPEHLDQTISRLENQAAQHFTRSKKLRGLRDLLQREREGNIWDPVMMPHDLQVRH